MYFNLSFTAFFEKENNRKGVAKLNSICNVVNQKKINVHIINSNFPYTNVDVRGY